MTQKLTGFFLVAAVSVGTAFGATRGIQAAVHYDFRVMTRDIAPGTSPELKYLLLAPPVINTEGQVAFCALVPDMNGQGYSGVWSEGSGSLELIIRRGEAAPQMPPGVYISEIQESSLLLNDSGQVLFVTNTYGPSTAPTRKEVIWSGDSGSLRLVAKTGDIAPGMDPGVTFEDFYYPRFNNAGQIAFFGTTNSSNSAQGIWSEQSGSLRLVARHNGPAPGSEPGTVFKFLSAPAFNEAGQTAFLSGTNGPGGQTRSIWSEGGGTLHQVIHGGDAAPGTGPGVAFDSAYNSRYDLYTTPALNDAGLVAFRETLTGPGVDDSNKEGIWSQGRGALELVARQGSAAPGTEPGVVYNGFSMPLLNNAGQTSFVASLTGAGVDFTNHIGVWSEDQDSLKLVARTGDAAPGAHPGEVFYDFTNLMFNASGQTAFIGYLVGPNVDSMNDLGVWATDPNGVLTLIARKGDTFDVNPDPLIEDLRTIIRITPSPDLGRSAGGGHRDWTVSFNDAGQIVFLLEFTNATQAVLVATVPEPNALAVVALGASLALRRRA